MNPTSFVRIPSLKSARDFGDHIHRLGIDLRFEPEMSVGDASALRQPIRVNGRTLGNRWAVHPMEGWDGTTTGGPTELTLRRWRRFGESGAKLIWGEAMAVRPEARANPHQLLISAENKAGLARLRETLIEAHQERFGRVDDLLIGFQLTHSGRFCRPTAGKDAEPKVAFRHPILDRKFNVTSDRQVLTDDELNRLVDDFVASACVAAEVGVDFVDIKHCHGYLLHEVLAGHTRPGPYGGSFENRTRLVREIVAGIRAAVPKLQVGVRLSALDLVPFKPDAGSAEPGKLGPGVPEDFSECLPYRYAFGVNQSNPVEFDLAETRRFLALLEELDVRLINLSAGSPYYTPHIQRPAMYPPSDGYQPPEDPLVGVARLINVTRKLKALFPNLTLVGTGYSYLQEYLPHVAEYYVRHGHVDIVGVGRAALSYPAMLADATTLGKLDTRSICRTLSDCTTAPRKGLRSGCYPLDAFYRNLEDAAELKKLKRNAGENLREGTKPT